MENLKKTKIVATLGPATDDPKILESIITEGVNVCRLNFSHGNHDEHQKRIDMVDEIRTRLALPIAIMLDTKGPEIRLGDFEEKEVTLEAGSQFILTTEEVVGTSEKASVSYANLHHDVSEGDRILIDDGLIELTVLKIDGKEIICKVENGGEISNYKGVNVPYVNINLPAVTDKDIADIKFGIKNNVDYVAASFIRKPEDVLVIRRILEDNGGGNIEIISKIENQEGVDNLDAIINVSDGIMVARGDLGVEIEPEEIPLIQKDMIHKCNVVGKPVITATQMLDSMIRNPRPTRAEVTDVANSILDGTSAIMLSGETAAGKYPVQSVKTMVDIALKIESSINYAELLRKTSSQTEVSTTNAIGKATCATAQDLNAKAILAATSSGYTARAIAKFKPKTPIIAATTSQRAARRLALDWGVYPVITKLGNSTDEILDYSLTASKKCGYLSDGDLVVITAGVPVGMTGSTNLIKVHTLGKLLTLGTGIGKEIVSGRVIVGKTVDELLYQFEDGDIIVTHSTDRDMVKVMKRASAVIVEEGGLTSHAAIVGLNLKIPTIVGAEGALDVLETGDIITLDAGNGQIYQGYASLI